MFSPATSTVWRTWMRAHAAPPTALTGFSGWPLTLASTTELVQVEMRSARGAAPQPRQGPSPWTSYH